jgi:hypothetical protein
MPGWPCGRHGWASLQTPRFHGPILRLLEASCHGARHSWGGSCARSASAEGRYKLLGAHSVALSFLLLPIIKVSIEGKESEEREKGSLPCANLHSLARCLVSAQPQRCCHPGGAPLCQGRRSGSLRRRVIFLTSPV